MSQHYPPISRTGCPS